MIKEKRGIYVMLKLYTLPIITPVWTDTDVQLLPFISKQRQEKVLSYRFSIDKKLSLYSALLTRMEISVLSGVLHQSLHFQSEFMHKPMLLSAPYYHFNFSHTKSMILCGISDTHPIGVDIERIDPSLNIETMKAVLHQTEFQYINSTYSNHERTDRFYKIWTQKEAYIKYMGTGFSADAHAFNMLDPKLSSKLFTWKQDCYLCSVFTDFQNIPSVQTVAESELRDYFLSPPLP